MYESEFKKKEILLKEIDLIESCINRMSNFSFGIKGWVITLAAACCAFSSLQEKSLNIVFLIGWLAVFIFWYLDAYFVRVERLYRYKYEWVITNRMLTEDYIFNLDPYNLEMIPDKKKVESITRIMFSSSMAPMYLLLIVIVAIGLIL